MSCFSCGTGTGCSSGIISFSIQSMTSALLGRGGMDSKTLGSMFMCLFRFISLAFAFIISNS